jgi:hypothetical protein
MTLSLLSSKEAFSEHRLNKLLLDHKGQIRLQGVCTLAGKTPNIEKTISL